MLEESCLKAVFFIVACAYIARFVSQTSRAKHVYKLRREL
jgi:hypothetical protein